jgi:hypothetical protein
LNGHNFPTTLPLEHQLKAKPIKQYRFAVLDRPSKTAEVGKECQALYLLYLGKNQLMQ